LHRLHTIRPSFDIQTSSGVACHQASTKRTRYGRPTLHARPGFIAMHAVGSARGLEGPGGAWVTYVVGVRPLTGPHSTGLHRGPQGTGSGGRGAAGGERRGAVRERVGVRVKVEQTVATPPPPPPNPDNGARGAAAARAYLQEAHQQPRSVCALRAPRSGMAPCCAPERAFPPRAAPRPGVPCSYWQPLPPCCSRRGRLPQVGGVAELGLRHVSTPLSVCDCQSCLSVSGISLRILARNPK